MIDPKNENCVYRGRRLRVLGCDGCQKRGSTNDEKHARLVVFHCDVFGQCAMTPNKRSIQSCEDCKEYR